VNNDTPELRDILSQIKDLEHQGYEFEAAEASLFILIRKVLKHQEPPFRVEAYHVSMRREGVSSVCEATVKIRVDGRLAHKVAEGDGPVNALDSALRRALLEFFPEKLKKVVLTDYKVRILDVAPGVTESFRRLRKSKAPQTRAAAEADHAANAEGNMRGTAAKTRVLIQSSDGNKEWGTVGVSENIIEASLQALVDSMEYALSRKGS
jgi:2-isopropylmalate synthase